ncbi:MAG TPA: TIM barrel protein [Clostridia bacterium]|nr:TIM barrel protein [Clostridia bacterium]
MLRIGPSGNSDSFYQEGYKHTYEAFGWLAKKGLNAYEYSFGKGVRMSDDTAEIIRQEADRHSFFVSVHAPYYINFAGSDADKLKASQGYLISSVKAARKLGAKRCVFHPGSCTNIDRADALARAKVQIGQVLQELYQTGYDDVILCPETLGKINQLGTLEEIVDICKEYEALVPAIDFGHLHARSIGGIKNKDDYRRILDYIGDELGENRLKSIHVHFSKIEFTDSGEKMHRTFADEGFGPDFLPLAELINEYMMSPALICESRGTMAEDAAEMLEIWQSVK